MMAWLVLGDVLDGGPGAHHEASAARLVGFENSGSAVDDAAGREVRPLHKFQNLRQCGLRIIHQRDGRVDDLSEIVRRNLRRHADRNTVRAVHQQVRNTRGQERRARLQLPS